MQQLYNNKIMHYQNRPKLTNRVIEIGSAQVVSCLFYGENTASCVK